MKSDNVPLGVAVIVFTVLMMALTDALIKYISADFPLWQIFVVRSLIAVFILIVLILSFSDNSSLKTQETIWVLVRSVALVLMYLCIYAAIPLLDLSVVAATLYTGPIFTALLSIVFTDESFSVKKFAAIVLGFIGVLVVLSPNSDEFNLYALIPTLAGFLYAVSAIITRAKCANEDPKVLALYLNITLLVFGAAITCLLLLGTGELFGELASYQFMFGDWVTMDYKEWGIFVGLACLVVVVAIGFTVAYQKAPSTIIATFDYSYLIFAAIFGYYFFQDIPRINVIIGMLIIASAGILIIYSPHKTNSSS